MLSYLKDNTQQNILNETENLKSKFEIRWMRDSSAESGYNWTLIALKHSPPPPKEMARCVGILNINVTDMFYRWRNGRSKRLNDLTGHLVRPACPLVTPFVSLEACFPASADLPARPLCLKLICTSMSFIILGLKSRLDDLNIGRLFGKQSIKKDTAYPELHSSESDWASWRFANLLTCSHKHWLREPHSLTQQILVEHLLCARRFADLGTPWWIEKRLPWRAQNAGQSAAAEGDAVPRESPRGSRPPAALAGGF